METQLKRRRNKRILIVLALLISGGFIGLLMISSAHGMALKELENCKTELDVKQVWENYRSEMGEDADFMLEIRQKLTSFNLPQEKIDDCLTWLPVTNEFVNIIIIPDLSTRIVDTENYPGQIERDTDILQSIWKEFIALTGNRESKNQLIFALTDGSRMHGPIQEKIDNLFVSLDGEENTPKHGFFTPYRTTKFNKNCRQLYELAAQDPIKADFYTLLKSSLESYIKRSNFYDKYVNKLIILTDGHLEEDTGGGYTALEEFDKEFNAAANKDSILKCITKNGLNLTPVDMNWADTEVMICEINGGVGCKTYCNDVLTGYWEDWFTKMECRVEILQGNLPTKLICTAVRDFVRR